MTPQASPQPSGTTRKGIRRGAAVVALAVGLSLFGLNLWHGKDLFQAASVGAAVTLCGFADWWFYHLVSRRNNGLITAVQGMYAGMPTRPYQPFLISLSIGLAIGLPIALMTGLLLRNWRPEKKIVSMPGPMFDAEADAASV